MENSLVIGGCHVAISDNPVEAREILGSLLWTDGHSYRVLRSTADDWIIDANRNLLRAGIAVESYFGR
jgi:hypothetical protein